MNVAAITVDQQKAAELYRQYREHRDAQTDVDRKIEAVYRQISRGKKVIRALESIRQAGKDTVGRPKLAICRADAQWCILHEFGSTCEFSSDVGTGRIEIKNWTRSERWIGSHKARVPLIPVHLRPKANLRNYHILWEADWEAVPVDPMLLRRMGPDLWIVLAAWDLTEVERAVLSQ